MSRKKRIKTEYIPDDAEIYRRVHPKERNPKTGKIQPGAFMVRKQRNEKALSVCWGKYTTPEKASADPSWRRRVWPLGELKAHVPREIELDVLHDPRSSKDLSHSKIAGDKLLGDEYYDAAQHLAEHCVLIRNVVRGFSPGVV